MSPCRDDLLLAASQKLLCVLFDYTPSIPTSTPPAATSRLCTSPWLQVLARAQPPPLTWPTRSSWPTAAPAAGARCMPRWVLSRVLRVQRYPVGCACCRWWGQAWLGTQLVVHEALSRAARDWEVGKGGGGRLERAATASQPCTRPPAHPCLPSCIIFPPAALPTSCLAASRTFCSFRTSGAFRTTGVGPCRGCRGGGRGQGAGGGAGAGHRLGNHCPVAPAVCRIILENSGVAEPQNIRDQFNDALASNHPLMKRIFLDTLVTGGPALCSCCLPSACVQMWMPWQPRAGRLVVHSRLARLAWAAMLGVSAGSSDAHTRTRSLLLVYDCTTHAVPPVQWWTATPSSRTTRRVPRWRHAPTWGRAAACARWSTCWWSRSSEWACRQAGLVATLLSVYLQEGRPDLGEVAPSSDLQIVIPPSIHPPAHPLRCPQGGRLRCAEQGGHDERCNDGEPARHRRVAQPAGAGGDGNAGGGGGGGGLSSGGERDAQGSKLLRTAPGGAREEGQPLAGAWLLSWPQYAHGSRTHSHLLAPTLASTRPASPASPQVVACTHGEVPVQQLFGSGAQALVSKLNIEGQHR